MVVTADPVALMLVVPTTVRAPKVPTEVKEEPVTVELRVEPVNVPAAAVTVISAEPLNETPLMFRAVCNTVAVPALPPMLRLVTGVVEVTTNGAVPVAKVEVS